jgi:zinc protease
MMFKGSAHVAPGAFSQIVAREGGQDNAFTSRDVTAYHQHVAASRLGLVMRMEADRFAAPLIPPETVEPERLVVLEERRQRTDSSPRARFFEAFDAALWGRQHWRGRPIIGWEEEIRAITREDVVAFFGERYAPANAVLVVAGAVREATLRPLAEEFYGAVPVRPHAGRNRAPPPAAPVEPRVVRHDPSVREALLVRSFVAPSLTWSAEGGNAGQAWALELVAHLLGSGPGSRLFRALVETGLATAAGASYGAEAAGATTFSASATLRPGVAPERLEAALDAALDTLLQDGPSEAERERSFRQITAGALLTLDSINGVPRMLGGGLAIGLPLDTIEYWPRRLRAVTLAEMTAAARAVLGAAPRATGWLLPGAPA